MTETGTGSTKNVQNNEISGRVVVLFTDDRSIDRSDEKGMCTNTATRVWLIEYDN